MRLGVHSPDLGPRSVPYISLVRAVEASRIEDDKAIRVLLVKNAITTGWDCPRAEVMMSFRRARDRT